MAGRRGAPTDDGPEPEPTTAPEPTPEPPEPTGPSPTPEPTLAEQLGQLAQGFDERLTAFGARFDEALGRFSAPPPTSPAPPAPTPDPANDPRPPRASFRDRARRAWFGH